MEGGRTAGRAELLRHRAPDPRGQPAGVPFLLRAVPVQRPRAGGVGAARAGGDGAAAEVVTARVKPVSPPSCRRVFTRKPFDLSPLQTGTAACGERLYR